MVNTALSSQLGSAHSLRKCSRDLSPTSSCKISWPAQHQQIIHQLTNKVSSTGYDQPVVYQSAIITIQKIIYQALLATVNQYQLFTSHMANQLSLLDLLVSYLSSDHQLYYLPTLTTECRLHCLTSGLALGPVSRKPLHGPSSGFSSGFIADMAATSTYPRKEQIGKVAE